jgi:Adenylate and Guanylate cyclase catalytic domain
VQIRVGINSGEVIVRSVGSDLRWDYTAVGPPTHIAARMEQLAAPAATILTDTTLALARHAIRVRPLGRIVVKGLRDELEAYELVGLSPAAGGSIGPRGSGVLRSDRAAAADPGQSHHGHEHAHEARHLSDPEARHPEAVEP